MCTFDQHRFTEDSSVSVSVFHGTLYTCMHAMYKKSSRQTVQYDLKGGFRFGSPILDYSILGPTQSAICLRVAGVRHLQGRQHNALIPSYSL